MRCKVPGEAIGTAWEERYRPPSVSALYLHVPFCSSKCAYCDFASWVTRADDAIMGRYVRSLMAQLDEVTAFGLLDGVRTAYVGGGTPSLLGPTLLGQLVSRVRELCPELVELSCEANPESLSDELLCALVQSGATRVSMGVQSLDDAELAALGRAHTADVALKRLEAAVASGLDVSCDLMCAIPLQTRQGWLRSLEGVASLGVAHVSVYPLSIEEGTALARRVGDAVPTWNDGDVQAARMREAQDFLDSRGLSRYEVASYARPGRECRHNLCYWTGRAYLGLGTGASSMLTCAGYGLLRSACPQLPPAPDGCRRVRLRVRSGRREVCKGQGISALSFDLEFLTLRQAVAEDLMLDARLMSGVSPRLLALAREVMGPAAVDGCVREVTDMGLARSDATGALVPTEQGWLLGNELYGALWGLSEGDVLVTSSPA